MSASFLLVVTVLLSTIHYSENAPAYPVTFGTSISQGFFPPGQETPLWDYSGSGMTTYFWCTEANDPVSTGNTLFRVYVDDDGAPLEFTLDMLAGIGFDDNTAPKGNEFFGKGALSGGVYTTLRIPFSSRIKITGTVPATSKGATFWWVFRGVKNMGVNIAGYALPDSAKLKLYKNEITALKPLEYVTLADTSNNGAVWMVTLVVQSANLNYLEGCMRMYLQGASTPVLLSSGTEDYFQSAFYFDAGEFYFPEAGLTHMDNKDGTLSAFKVHNMDALFFESGGFKFTWRNGDMDDPQTKRKCVDQGSPAGNPQPSNVTTYTWVYEW